MHTLLSRQHLLWTNDLSPMLAAHGILLHGYSELDGRQHDHARGYYDREVFPVLTPLAVDPGHPFPHISNLSLNLGVVVDDPTRGRLFARIKVPSSLPRLVQVPAAEGTEPGAHHFIWLEQVVAANLDTLFPGPRVIDYFIFRVTRDADVEILDDEADDLLRSVEQSVRQRYFGSAVCLETHGHVPEDFRGLLVQNLDLSPADQYGCDGPLALGDLMSLYSLDRPMTKDEPLQPVLPRDLEGHIFENIRRGVIPLHHPYDSFAPVIEFIETAALDREDHYRRLLVAPVSLRAELERRIRRETALAKQGKPARLLFKVNALQDYPCTDLLYEAAAAGVIVDLIVRRICIARPDLPELKNGLRVVSIVGRFLEHSRAYCFGNGGDEELFLGSADLMSRNLDRRVETLFPIEDAAMRRMIKVEHLERYLFDSVGARRLGGEGRYDRVKCDGNAEPFGIQEWLVERARQGPARN